MSANLTATAVAQGLRSRRVPDDKRKRAAQAYGIPFSATRLAETNTIPDATVVSRARASVWVWGVDDAKDALGMGGFASLPSTKLHKTY
jgi:hypothetical protein